MRLPSRSSALAALRARSGSACPLRRRLRPLALAGGCLRLLPVLLLAAVAGAPAVERTVLPNGLVLVVDEVRTAPLAAIAIHLRSGPAWDGAFAGTGAAAAVARLLSQASDEGPVAAALARAGGRLDVHLDAEGTVLLAVAPDAEAAGLLRLFGRWLGDLARTPPAAFPAPGPADPLDDALRALLLRRHPARLPLAGLPGAVPSHDVLASFLRSRLASGGVTVVAAGNLSAPALRAVAGEAFSGLPLGFPVPLHTAEPLPAGPRAALLARPGPPRSLLLWRTEPPEHRAFPALLATAELLRLPGGPLARALAAAEPARPLGIEAVTVAVGGITGVAGWLSVGCAAEARTAIDGALRSTIDQIAARGPEPADLARARRAWRRADAELRASAAGRVRALLAWEIALADPGQAERLPALVERVEAEDVRTACLRWLAGPEGDVRRAELSLRPAEDSPPPPAAPPPSAAAARPEELRLEHGVRLLLRAAPQAPLCAVHVALGGGIAAEDELSAGAAGVLAALCGRAGENLPARALADQLVARAMTLRPGASPHSLGLTLTCLPADAPVALELGLDLVLRPALDAETVDAAQRLAAGQPAAWADRVAGELRRAVLDEHYAARAGTAGTGRLDRAAIAAFHRRLRAGGNLVVAVYGAAERSAVIERLKELVLQAGALDEGPAVLPHGRPWPSASAPVIVAGWIDSPRAAVGLAWHAPDLAEQAREGTCTTVLAALLEARLQRALALAPGDVRVSSEAYDRRGLLLASLRADAAGADAAVQTARTTASALAARLAASQDDPELAAELAAAANRCRAAWAEGQEDQAATAARHAENLLTGGDPASDAARADAFSQVDRRALARLAVLIAAEPSVVVLKPRPGEGGR